MTDLNLSQSAYLLLDDSSFDQDKNYDSIIVSNEISSEIFCSTTAIITSLIIYNCPANIYCPLNLGNNKDFIDLTPFTNLRVVVLKYVENDVLFPSHLDKLFLSQGVDEYGYEFQQQKTCRILNQNLSCRDITIDGFDLTGIQLTDFESINLQSTKVDGDVLDLSGVRNLTSVRLRDVANDVLLPNHLDQLDLSQSIVMDENGNIVHDQQTYRILNQQISSGVIIINNFDLTGVILAESKSICIYDCKMDGLGIQNCHSINMYNILIDGDVLDLSGIENLKSVKLENVDNNVLLPNQLDKLYLYQSGQNHRILNQYMSSKDIIILNFDLTGIVLKDFEVIELKNCKSNNTSVQSFLLPNIKTAKQISLTNFEFGAFAQVLDLTLFSNLLKVIFIDTQLLCSSIKVGADIKNISIQCTTRNTFDILDFSRCLSLETAKITNFDIRQILMINDIVEFGDSQVNIMDLRKMSHNDIGINVFIRKYQSTAKYIITYKADTKQQMVYSRREQNYRQVNWIPYILACKVDTINVKIQNLIAE